MSNPADDSLLTRRTLLSRLRDLDDHESWRTFFNLYFSIRNPKKFGYVVRVARPERRLQSAADQQMSAQWQQLEIMSINPRAWRFDSGRESTRP